MLSGLVLPLLLGAAAARAQPRELSDAEREEARALFVAGSAAVESGRWADAVGSFERAYQLTRAPSALYNLAVALRALGRHREARDAFARLLGEHELDDSMRARATTMRQEEAARVAVLELVGLDDRPGTTLRFDGRDVPDPGERPVRIETDAGSHTLIAERAGFERFVWQGTLGDGAHETVRIALRPSGDDTAVHVVLVVTAVVALAAGGAVLGWVLHEDAQVAPRYPQRVTL